MTDNDKTAQERERAHLDTGTVPDGWKLVPAKPVDAWVHSYANWRQGQWFEPRCESPSEYDLGVAREHIKGVLDAAPQPPASASAEPLGRFGHHPDPALDFCIEVEEIEGDAENIRVGFEGGTPSRDELHSRIDRAMEFRVGGDDSAVRAKDRLREIEAGFCAPAPAVVDLEQRSVSSNDACYDVEERALYTAPPAQPVAVSVMPLKWGNERLCDDGRPAQDPPTSIGTYVATKTGWFLIGRAEYEVEDSLSAAKVACQSDYEQRIRSALVIEPAQPVSCIACEDHPQAPNDPCHICGRSSVHHSYARKAAEEMRDRVMDIVWRSSPGTAMDTARLLNNIRALPLPGDKAEG